MNYNKAGHRKNASMTNVLSATIQLVIGPFQSIKSIVSYFGEGISEEFPATSEKQQALQ